MSLRSGFTSLRVTRVLRSKRGAITGPLQRSALVAHEEHGGRVEISFGSNSMR
jgi:hypothetical protein